MPRISEVQLPKDGRMWDQRGRKFIKKDKPKTKKKDINPHLNYVIWIDGPNAPSKMRVVSGLLIQMQANHKEVCQTKDGEIRYGVRCSLNPDQVKKLSKICNLSVYTQTPNKDIRKVYRKTGKP